MKYIITVLFFLLAASTVHAAGERILYQLDGKTYEGYFISPSAKAPLVLLLHDSNGITDYEIRRADMLADMGYTVFVADLFGAGSRIIDLHQDREYLGELYKDRDKMLFLIRGALGIAKSKGANTGNAVAMGYCFGGAAVLELARSGADLKGFVTFHGGLKTPEGQDYAKTKGTLLILHGSGDELITMDEFAGLATELEAQGIPHEMITYGGAPHEFTVFGTENYREDADRKSWQRLIGFLDETLK